MNTVELSCYRCGKTFPAENRKNFQRAFCSNTCRCQTYREEHKKPGQQRQCRHCSKPFRTSNRGQIKYCSDACLRAARRATDRSLAGEGVIPVGKVFVRSDDKTPVKVLIDPTGLPYAEPMYLWQP